MVPVSTQKRPADQMTPEQDSSCLKALIDDLKERLYKLRTFDSAEQVEIYCDDLESEVIMTVESAIKHMMKVQQDLLKEIRCYKSSLIVMPKLELSQFETVPVQLKNGSDSLELIKQDLLRLEKHVNEFSNTTDAKTSALKEADAIKTRIRALDTWQREQAFNGKFLHLKPNHLLSLTHNSVGAFEQLDHEPNNWYPELKNLYHDSAITTGHTALIRELKFLCLDLVASCSHDQAVKIWNMKTGQLHSTLEEKSVVFSLACLPDGHLACGLEDGCINVWDWEAKAIRKTFQISHMSRGPYEGNSQSRIRFLELLKSGNLVSKSSMDLQVWSLFSRQNPKPIRTINKSNISSAYDYVIVELSNGYLVTGTTRVCSSSPRTISGDNSYCVVFTVWTSNFEKKVDTIEFPNSSLRFSNNQINSFLALSNDLVVVGDDASVRVYDLIERSLCMTLIDTPSSGNLALAELANGYLAAAFNEYLHFSDPRSWCDGPTKQPLIRIYNMTNGKLVQSIEFELGQQITTMSSSSDRKTLVVGFKDGSIKVLSL